MVCFYIKDNAVNGKYSYASKIWTWTWTGSNMTTKLHQRGNELNIIMCTKSVLPPPFIMYPSAVRCCGNLVIWWSD